MTYQMKLFFSSLRPYLECLNPLFPGENRQMSLGQFPLSPIEFLEAIGTKMMLGKEEQHGYLLLLDYLLFNSPMQKLKRRIMFTNCKKGKAFLSTCGTSALNDEWEYE